MRHVSYVSWENGSCVTSSQAFYLRDQDLWTKIDYQAKADAWMKPLVRGSETGLVEIPANWYLDDLPPMMCVIPLYRVPDTELKVVRV